VSHARQQIRDAVVAALTGLETTWYTVFASRIWPLEDGTIPGLIVYTSTEEIDEEQGKIAKIQHRDLTITIKGRDKLSAGLDDQLDTMAAEIEAAIHAADLGRVYALDLLSTEMNIADGLEQPVGELTMIYRVQYLTDEGTPTVAI